MGQSAAGGILAQAEKKGCCCSPELTFHELHVVCLQGAALAGERHIAGPAAVLLMCLTEADLRPQLSAVESEARRGRPKGTSKRLPQSPGPLLILPVKKLGGKSF